MRFAYLTRVYPQYARLFYAARPALSRASYREQLAALQEDAFGWNGAWAPALQPLGYETCEILSNVGPLQRAWALENGVAWPRVSSRAEVPLSQLKNFRPDVLLLDDPRSFDRHWLKRLREACPMLRLVLGYSGSAAFDLGSIREYDAVLSCTLGYVEFFRRQGCRAFLLRHAFNPEVLKALGPPGEPLAGVSFVGSVVRSAGYHLEREKLLEAVQEAMPLGLYCPQSEIGRSREMAETAARRGAFVLTRSLEALGVGEEARRRLPLVGRAATWTEMPMRLINPRLRRAMKPAVYGLAMFRLLARSAVALNNHVDVAGDEAANMRLFEATGVGTCLLTDAKSTLGELFEADREVVAYRSVEECVEKARWLLDHAADRATIARAGQARTLRDHTFGERAKGLHDLIGELLASTGKAALS
jgi:spore maturation protein CgeB